MTLQRLDPFALMMLSSLCALAALSAGCIDDESVFTQGKLENLCAQSIVACNTQASCVMTDKDFYRGQFPGGLKVLVRTEAEDSSLFARFLLTDPIAPGTEIQVTVNTPNCGDSVTEHPQDIDLFDLAGRDRTLEFELDMPGRGDHLVEIFSDMRASFLMAFEIEE